MDVVTIADAVSRAVGGRIRIVGPTARGESGTTFDVEIDDVDAILKLSPDRPEALHDQQRLVGLVDSLRARGCPAPPYLGVGSVAGAVFTLQRRLSGRTLEPRPGEAVDPDLLSTLLPEILAAVERQRDAGDLIDPPWPAWMLETIYSGGEGYCLHDTLRQRPETASLLDQLVHLATAAASTTSGQAWTVVYLTHLVLRQVEWTIRHRPHSPEEERFLRIATMVLADCQPLVA